MKANDVASGLALLLLGVVLWLAADALPNPARQIYGPSFFPKWVGGGLVLGSLVLIITSLDQIGKEAFVRLEPWLFRPVTVIQVLLVPVLVIAYVQFVDLLGFAVTSLAALLIMFLALGVRPLLALPTGAVVVALIHVIFSMLLRVPLAGGSLF